MEQCQLGGDVGRDAFQLLELAMGMVCRVAGVGVHDDANSIPVLRSRTAVATSPQQHGVQSIEVGMRVLTAIERGGGPMPLSRIAAGSGLAPSKTHRYLVSLQRTGLVSQEVGTGLYNLGPAARRLGVEALRRVDDVATASPHAAALRDRTGHTTALAWSARTMATIRCRFCCGSGPSCPSRTRRSVVCSWRSCRSR
jgi:hypothetical protein